MSGVNVLASQGSPMLFSVRRSPALRRRTTRCLYHNARGVLADDDNFFGSLTGELHNTSPGHMRNVLYPSGLALYQPRIRGLDGAASASSTIFSETEAAAAAGRSATSSSSAAARALGLSVADLLALQTQLESLPPLMFERPTTTTSSNPAAPQAHQQGQEEQIPSLSIHGSVGLTEILSELRNHHGVMDGTLAGSGKKASAACEYELKAIGSGPRLEKEKIKKTGEYAGECRACFFLSCRIPSRSWTLD